MRYGPRESWVRQFGDLEAAVMARLWDNSSPMTVRQVLEELQQERRIAYTTVMTVMDNLHRKGFLARDVQGRAYRYRPTRSREECSADLMEEVLEASDDRNATLAHFVGRMSSSELRRLRKLLEGRATKSRRR